MKPCLIKVVQSFEIILYMCENHAATNALNNCLEDVLLFREPRQIYDINFEYTKRTSVICRYSNWNLFQKVYQTLKVLLYDIHRQAFVPITRPSI